MTVLGELDAPALRAWGEAGLAGLGAARAEIDALNVFPIPDGDTGTNLFLTFEAGVAAASSTPTADAAQLTAAFARGALLGARGNSGVIVAQLLRGMAESFSTVSGPVRGEELAAALKRAADLGYAAVARPVEGTVLTVARAAAAAVADQSGLTLRAAIEQAAEAARVALAHTPEQLEALRRAGVVDAGGRGLVVLLDALVAVVTGTPQLQVEWERPEAVTERPVHGGDPEGPDFEIMYLLEAADVDVANLREALDRLGDSVVVVGGDGLWNVHVHADDPGAAVEAAVAHGRPFRIRITSLTDRGSEAAVSSADQDVQPAARSVVVVAPGKGLAHLFESVGAIVVEGSPGDRPAIASLLAAIESSNSAEVVVLPNDPDHLATAEVAAERARTRGLRVAVVPTRAVVQGLAALAVHDTKRRMDDDVVAMTSAAGSTRHGAITLAVREAMTTAGICRKGDVLGLIDGDVAVLGEEVSAVAMEIVDRMLTGGGELVTLVRGSGETVSLAQAVQHHLHRERPEVEVVVYDGEQAHYPLLLGVE